MHYFAYGSNLLVARLQARTPSARLITRATLRGFTPRFHKVGDDGSGKGDAFHTGNHADVVEGVVYHLHADDLVILDRIEGVGHGYTRETCQLETPEGSMDAWVYVAESFRIDPAMRPFHWYKAL